MEDMILRHPDGREVKVPGWLVKDKLEDGYTVIGPLNPPKTIEPPTPPAAEIPAPAVAEETPAPDAKAPAKK